MEGSLALADFRRRVADNYARARATGGGSEAWTPWRMARDEIFRDHPESPVPVGQRPAFTGMAFFPYDPSWHLEADVEPAAGAPPALAEAGATFARIGTAVAERAGEVIRLPLLWTQGYGGGLFLPFRDATNGDETYGGGRYLIDQVKGADLGASESGRLILDFNFAVHPSCAHDPRWECPLAPPESRLPMPVRAGELMPGTAPGSA